MTQKELKFIKSLHLKKNRIENSLFIVEGKKAVSDMLCSHYKLNRMFFTSQNTIEYPYKKAEQISQKQMERISNLKTFSEVLAVFEMPKHSNIEIENELVLVLDDIRDPGNLGTIIRTANWFGIQKIVCSKKTVEVYNSKVIQATMGAIANVQVYYTDLNEFLSKQKMPTFGAFLKGQNIYKEKLPKKAIIVIGNEANGITKKVEKNIKNKILIPSFGQNSSDSLNVGIATGVILSEFKRR